MKPALPLYRRNTSLPRVLQIAMLGDGFSRIKNSSVRAIDAYARVCFTT